MMENEIFMKLDVPECWYEHDLNGERISLSFIGRLAVMSVGIAVARSIFNFLIGSSRTQEEALQNQLPVLSDNSDIDEVMK